MKKRFLKILAGLSLMLGLSACQNDHPNSVVVNGHFTELPANREISLNYAKEGRLVVHSTTLINKDGDFSFSLPAPETGFYYIDYNSKIGNSKSPSLRLYLKNGFDIDLNIKGDSVSLSGDNIGHNDLVLKANDLFKEFAEYNKLGGIVTFKDFFPYLEKEGVTKVEALKNSISTPDAEFNQLLKLAIQSDFENELFGFVRYPRTAHPTKEDFPEIYNSLVVDGIKFNDPEIFRLANGFNWMETYFFFKQMQGGFKGGLKDRIYGPVQEISVPKLKEAYIIDCLKRYKINAQEYTDIVTPLYQYLISEESKAFLVEREKELHKNEGQPGFEFTYTDTNDKPVSFKDFRGKYVYIDVWATWCGPCKKEIPYLKELEEQYKGKDIVFMSVSVDAEKDRNKWKEFVKSESLKGVQLMADKAFNSGITKNYGINAIPRFLLFDKEGKIISIDAMRPSNPKLKEEFDRLLKS
ncbi:TlpA family protein disulfide reductase [Robertkochia solimangrovi]|uniref:TlpA family protein disulfide reductase n=1 Tax=Robertkochia solimangrovi TaxID=2213046 RepID=UPI00117CDFC0|nr:TlpA disulfide reductase family protein [Robertkochia solimangrovi]TRZ43497.1 hypothetical protein DMZ48_08705 [Robertkochia solimangrovi]